VRIRAVLVAGVASLSVIGIGWQLGASALDAHQGVAMAAPNTAGNVVSGSGPATMPPPAGSSASAGAGAAPAAPAPAPSASTGTFPGSVVQTQYGSVQVSVTIANGTITDVAAMKLTDRGGRSVAISNQAAPILRSEVLTAQSARVQNVGGATYTTYGYLTSLQAALDAARF